jgi:hypothetical protein
MSNEERNQRGSVLHGAAVLLAIGIALGGWLAGRGFVASRTADRFVTVKGVAERDVRADLALWPLRYMATDDDLIQAQSRVEASREKILGFLEGEGIAAESVELQRMEVEDRVARSYGDRVPGSRYTITQTLMVRSDDPELVHAASQKVGELVNAGVVLTGSGGWSGGPTYLFTRLNEFKPVMIAEATANAREAAQKFADDAGTDLGGIRRANQGVFQILARDRAPGISVEGQLHKTLRVVSTVEYQLGD